VSSSPKNKIPLGLEEKSVKYIVGDHNHDLLIERNLHPCACTPDFVGRFKYMF